MDAGSSRREAGSSTAAGSSGGGVDSSTDAGSSGRSTRSSTDAGLSGRGAGPSTEAGSSGPGACSSTDTDSSGRDAGASTGPSSSGLDAGFSTDAGSCGRGADPSTDAGSSGGGAGSSTGAGSSGRGAGRARMRGSKNRSTKDGRHRKLLEDHIQGVARQRATNPQRRSCYVMCTPMGAARVVRLVDGSPELRWQVPCRTCQGAVSVSAGDENQEQTRPGAGRPGDKKRGRVRDRPAGETGDADMEDGGRRRGADQSSRSRSPVQYAWTTAYADTPCPERVRLGHR